MAKIESRRIWRKFGGIALIAAAVLAVFAIVAAAILVPKSCSAKKAGETADAAVSPEPASPDTSETTPAVTQAPSVPPQSPQPSKTPSSASDGSKPHQVTEDRSFAGFTLSILSAYDEQGGLLMRVEGDCVIRYVNNTDSELYAAELCIGEFDVLRASVNGAAARFSCEEQGVCTVPFVLPLAPGEEAEVYIGFSGRVPASRRLTLPHPNYDTVYDLHCTVRADSRLVFSEGEATRLYEGARTVYLLSAEGVKTLDIGFGDSVESTEAP